jgi:hypothetical protein
MYQKGHAITNTIVAMTARTTTNAVFLSPKNGSTSTPITSEILFSITPKFPTTFDGSLPSEAFGAAASRVKIGESYLFQNVVDVDTVGTVTYATVWESEKKAAISVTFTDGMSRILTQPMTDAEFSDYKAHPDAYFGKILPVGKQVENQYELFEFFVEANKGLSRAMLLQRLGKPVDFDPQVSDADLLAEYCEALAAAVPDPAKKSA